MVGCPKDSKSSFVYSFFFILLFSLFFFSIQFHYSFIIIIIIIIIINIQNKLTHTDTIILIIYNLLISNLIKFLIN